MPKVRRQNIPRELYAHLLDRVQSREISGAQLILFLEWLEQSPEVPLGRWFKKFPSMTVCGEGELVKTFLRADQTPTGTGLP
jgi:hypothetical protein